MKFIAGYSSAELRCLISIARVVEFHYPQPISMIVKDPWQIDISVNQAKVNIVVLLS